MRMFRLLTLTVVCLSSLFLGFAAAQEAQEEHEDADTLRLRAEWFHHQRAYPLKHIPTGARQHALQQRNRMMQMQAALTSLLPTSTPAWTLVGPQPSIPLGSPFGGSPTASGRVSALAVDPTNANVVYLGGANGGVWKSTDAGNTWTPLMDTQPSLSVGAIAIDPSNHNTIYVGTGEGNYAAGGIIGDSYYGVGILKSTNGGSTWTQIAGPFVGPFGSTSLDGGAFIGALAVSPSSSSVLLAGLYTSSATNPSGVYRTADGGTTWTLVLDGNPASPNPGTSIVFDPTNGSNVYAALGNFAGDPLFTNGVYKSTDGGQHWTEQFGESSNVAGRMVLAIAPSSPTTLYVSVAEALSLGGDALVGVWKTTNGGTNWTQLTSVPDFCNAQCNYDMDIKVAPNNANVVYATGIYDYNTASQTTVIRSLDGGTTWTLEGAGANGTNVHTDGHALAFSADSSTLYVGSDGGAWKTANVATSPLNWTDLNGPLAITEFYGGLAVDPSDVNIAFGGAQDNGTQQYTGSTTWNIVTCGDAGFNAIDPGSPSTVYVSCSWVNHPFLQKSTTGGGLGTYTGVTTGINTTDRASFIPPFVMDPSNSMNLYVGTYLIYQTTDGAGAWTAISPDVTFGGNVAAIAVAPNNNNTIYTGSDDGRIAVTTNALTGVPPGWSDISPIGLSRAITDIAVDPSSSTTAYITYSGFSGFADTHGHVITTTNGGTSYTDISSNLPNTPVNCIVIDPDIASTLYIGTDIGVFVTSNGGASWSVLGAGLPDVAVLSLAFHHATRTLFAATHGRSVWSVSLATNQALTVTLAGTGSGSVSSSPSGISCPSTCSAKFASGTPVTLTATAAAGSTFAGWSGACSGTGTCSVTMTAAKAVTATFNAVTFALTVTEAGTGSGSVSSSPSGISCPGTCSANFASGTPVTLTATAAAGSTFAGWSGACSGTGTCSVTMTAAKAVTATFNAVTFALTVTEAGTGSGSVSSSPSGISCPSTCSANFASGTMVTLTATATAGSTFAGWSGACSGTGTCSVTMTAAKAVTATFNAVTFALTVTEAGTGSGSVSSSPSGISCPSTCSANFPSGTPVTLTATAAAGSTFAGWSGACSGTGTCSVTMTAAKAVTATFNAVTFALTVTEAGTGSGSVSSSPSGISCPSTCSANFASGTMVTLTATAAAGSTFAGWSGACSGTGTCSVTMTAAKAVTATFNLVSYALNVTLTGTGSGSVKSSPSGISCPSTCSANFASGTPVTLTATAAAGSTFAGWSGACSGTGTCSVTMTAAKAVTATFNSSSSPAVTLTPTSLNFGTVATGVTSPVKTLTLKNSGKATLTITSIVITGTNSGDFPETSTCASSLAAGKTCLIRVQFKPSATGARSAAVSITDNAAGSPQQVPLSGTGTTAKLSPTPLNFGTLAVGLTSAVKKVTLTNVGTTALTISSIAVTGAEAADFPETGTTCGSSLAAAASCTVSLTFKPTTTGARSANLTVTDNASGSPQQVPLSGTGTTAELTPTSLSFGSVKVGTTSAAKTVTLKNVGTTAITISSITIAGTEAGDFGETNGCGSSLAASASCTISVTFKPTTTGNRSATLKVTDSAAGSPQQVGLSGTGS